MGSKEKKLTQDSTGSPVTWYGKSFHLLLLAILVLSTYLTYSPGFSPEKQFTNWDDLGYVVNQPLIKTQDADSTALLWKPSTEVMLNYHPITMWTLAKNYESAELDIQPYFQTNLFLHCLNAILVFVLLFSLSKGSLFVSFFSALIFAIHPMHVESVAWISERKDVLYTFFFLLSILSYVRFQRKQNHLWLLICFGIFILSCLSKAMAVPLPFVLILLDYFNGRKINWKSLLEKIPFIIVAIWFGLNALEIQSKGAITDFDFFSGWQRVIFASYGYLSYWLKFFIPTELSAFYPYPNLDRLNELPLYFTLAPFILLISIGGVLILSWKRNVETFKISLLGIGFFSLMIALVLQFISVGAAITADRYSYIPYIGIVFMLLLLLEKWGLFQRFKQYMIGGVILYSLVFMFLSFERTKVWTNSGTLWSDVIEKYPFKLTKNGENIEVLQTGAEVAYKNRGNFYRENGDSAAAMKDYLVLVEAKVKDPLIYSNVGNMYALMNKFDSSLQMYTMALDRNPNAYDVYINRGITYIKMLNNKNAIKDFKKALALRPNDLTSLINLCAAQLNSKDYNACIKTSKDLTRVAPNRWEPHFYQGTAYINQGKYNLGAASLEKAIGLNQNDPYVWYNAGIAQQQIGNKEKARNYILKAKSLNYPVSDDLLNGL